MNLIAVSMSTDSIPENRYHIMMLIFVKTVDIKIFGANYIINIKPLSNLFIIAVALTNGKNIDIDFDGRPKISLDGYVTRRHENSWNIVCQDSLSIEQQEEAASHICRYLGFR